MHDVKIARRGSDTVVAGRGVMLERGPVDMTAQHQLTNPITADPALTLVPDGADVTTEQALLAAQQRADHLEEALRSSRVIGMALGIVIERCRLNPDEAFQLLVSISQRDHRKLRDIGSDLVFTGVIPDAT